MKKIVQRIITFILCLTLSLNIGVSVLADNESNELGVTFSAKLDVPSIESSSVEQTVVMTVKASMPITVDGIGFVTIWDSALTLKAIEGGEKIGAYDPASTNIANGIAGWSTSDSENISDVIDIAVITFTVPANTPAGVYSVGVEKLELTKDYGEIWEESASATATLTITEPNIAVSGVTLEPTTLTLTEGETATLTATVSPENATDKTVTWSSNDEAVATVENGKVTAVKKGTTTITATAGDVSATCMVTVECNHSNYEVTYADDADKHWQVCSGCYKTIDNSMAKHTYGEWIHDEDSNPSSHSKFCICGSWVKEECSGGEDDGNCETAINCSKCEHPLIAAGQHSFTKDSGEMAEAATCETNQKNFAKCEKCSVVSETETVEVENTALGHDYGEPTYTWSEDNTTCTAERICSRDADHKETETVNSSSKITQAQSCTAPELTKYTATFTNSVFEEQTKEVQTKLVAGHNLTGTDAKAATCTETGTIEYWECSVCTMLFSDAEGKTEVEKITTEIDQNNHESKEVYYTKNNADTHKKFHKCCDVLIGTEDHVWGEDDICDFCRYDNTHYHNVTLVEGKAPDCKTETNGQEEHYVCSCGAKFYDEAYTKPVANDEDLVIAWAHTLTHRDAVAANCRETGTIEYWECSVCTKLFSDAEGKTEVEKITTEIDQNNHKSKEVYYTENGADTHKKFHKCCNTQIGTEDHVWGEDDICDSCGYEKAHICDNGTLVSGFDANCATGTNGKKDYYECSCGAKFYDATCTEPVEDEADLVIAWAHTGGEATCTEKAVCKVCYAEYGEKAPHASDVIYTDNKDGKTHTVAYECCKVVINDEEPHTYENGECTCGAVESIEDPTPDDTEYVEIELEVGATATETQNGLSSALTDDDITVEDDTIVYVTMEVSKKTSGNSWWDNWGGNSWGSIWGDNWGDWWSNSSGTTTYDHTITFEALAEGTTVVQVGEVFYKVTVIEAHEHEYTEEVTEPTCTEQGYTTYTCDCGDSYVDNYVEASGHNYEDGVCTECQEDEPEISETFAPKSFTACLSKSSVTVGKSVTITVKTSTDVDYVEINGEVVDTYRTTTTGWGFNKTKYRTFTYTVSEDAAGTYEYEVYAYNADGAQSETSKTLTLTVKGFGGGSDWGWGDWWWN